METVYLAYTLVLVMLVPGAVMSFFAVNSAGAGLGPEQVPRLLIGLGLLLGLWYAVATVLAQAGLMAAPIAPFLPPTVGLFFVGGAVLLYILGRLLATPRRVIDQMGQLYFMRLQGFRLLGGIFLIGALAGDIPWLFALPAGLGDIWAGFLGLRAARAVADKAPDAAAKIKQANTVGVVDFIVALSIGLITSDTIYQLIATEGPNAVIVYPLVLIPTFLVPLFLAAHFFSIRALVRDNPAAAQPVA